MPFLQECLNILFRRESPERIIKRWLNDSEGYNPTQRNSVWEEISFQHDLLQEYQFFSTDEAANIQTYLNDLCADTAHSGYRGLFYSLQLAVAPMFTLRTNDELLCKHRYFCDFRELSHPIGPSIFSCAYLAYRDVQQHNSQGDRIDFCFSPSPESDNVRLKNMYARGLADNHFHLSGSAPAFLITWISLMNETSNRRREFEDSGIDINPLDAGFSTTYGTSRNSMRLLCAKAAYIRAFLFSKVLGQDFACDIDAMTDHNDEHISAKGNKCDKTDATDTMENKQLREWMELSEEPYDVAVNKLHAALQSLLLIHGHNDEQLQAIDYAYNGWYDSCRNPAYKIIAGEHRFLYAVFFAIFDRDPRIEPYLGLFYAYLIIWTRMRSEMVQTNKRIGFANFKHYQDRKEIFIEHRRKYMFLLDQYALSATIWNRNIQSLEARIVPKKNATQMLKKIKRLDKEIERLPCVSTNRCYYVLHMPKEKQRPARERDFLPVAKPRDYDMRKCSKDYADGIIAFRKSYPEHANRILGIDACSNEIGCRPEVFAPQFRRLKTDYWNMQSGITPINALRITYHVGEDFLDVIDGLRAIDEAILFLDLSHGDRIGHGMALGIDVLDWYQYKHYRICLPKQDLLDNLVWLYVKMKEMKISTQYVEHRIRLDAGRLYQQIYGTGSVYGLHDAAFSLETYWDSWQLRGDDPACYFSDPLDEMPSEAHCNDPTSYQLRPGLDAIRIERLPCHLMHRYHYSKNVRIEGARITDYTMPDEFIQAIIAVQKGMQHEIARANIAIECNPSSNVLIGHLMRYEKHPLIALNNMYLSDNDKDNARMFVSINTDDLGIFDTTLENEYALLACGLERANERMVNPTSPDRIYAWLDHIRKLGIEQSFINYNDRTN